MAAESGTYISDFDPTNPNPATDPVSEGADHLQIIKLWIQNTFPNVNNEVLPTPDELNYLVGVTAPIQDQIDALGGGGGGNEIEGDFTVTDGDIIAKQLLASNSELKLYNEVNGGVKIYAESSGDFVVRKIDSFGNNGNIIMQVNGGNLQIHDPTSGAHVGTFSVFGFTSLAGLTSTLDADLQGTNTTVRGNLRFLASTNNHRAYYGSVAGGGNGLRIVSNNAAIDFQTAGYLRLTGLVIAPSGILTAGGDIDVQGGDYLNTSDERLKENIQDAEEGLEEVKAMRPVSFNYKDGAQDRRGLIAQELEQVLPQAVKSGEQGYKAVSYNTIIPVLIKAIQELEARVAELEGS